MKFLVRGEPQGKGRHRTFIRNGKVCNYTPDETVNYENWVKLSYQTQCKEPIFDKDVPLRMVIVSGFKIPKSASKKKREQMLDGLIRPTKKPDADNIIKVIADSLNSIAYHDDAQIADISITKLYAENPFVSVEIERLYNDIN